MEDSPLQAFRRVCNLRVLAAVYYFCLLYALSRGLTWFQESERLGDTLFAIVRYTRQLLISGLSLLLLVGLAEALLAATRWRGRAALAVQALAVGLAASLGTLARFEVAAMNDPSLRLRPAWMATTLALWVLFGGVAYALLRQSLAEQASRRALGRLAREREALLAQQTEAQLSALTAQIEPHFLFNTLANVKRLYETAPARGRHMLQALIAYLRAALPGMRRQESTLAEELELVRHYLAILQMRMGERLSFAIDAPPAPLGAHRDVAAFGQRGQAVLDRVLHQRGQHQRGQARAQRRGWRIDREAQALAHAHLQDGQVVAHQLQLLGQCGLLAAHA
ncbi:MAG: histidine kinase, partial [Roseateles sp.]